MYQYRTKVWLLVVFLLVLFCTLEEVFAMEDVIEDDDVKVEENEIKVGNVG